MEEEGLFEAGVFALASDGWTIVKRRTFTGQGAAAQWMKRSANTLAGRNPHQRVRGSVVRLGDWMTLEAVLANYETGRKAGDPEFEELPARQIVVNGQPMASYTARQGQFLAFIHCYTKLNRQPPAEADMARHFNVTPPVVHDMVLTLERKGLVARTPGMARSLRVLLPPEQLPGLE